ncbi:MFS transporter [Marinactinospora thermotolerans]|uniref:MFS transporter, sugar porter (SP) family n=1 Tax=Marinactinospora thermotolerans DSM 45154 TaxID=1122192 RepID=A0A1T4Q7C7_9ACTN|nr:MFS transporter, sugar porter (SP) family [Marinactinospora thermotolerans DSM 45154]
MASVVTSAYIAEIAPPRLRGRMASLQQMAVVVGITVSQVVNLLPVTAAGGSAGDELGPFPAWRWMPALGLVPAVLYYVLSLSLPESPRFLAGTGRLDRARRSLRRLGREVERIRRERGAAPRPRLRDLLGSAGLLPIVWVGVVFAALQQFVGINAVFSYSTSLWHSVGFGEARSLSMSLVTSFVNIAGTVVALLLIDRLGRRPLLMAGSLGVAAALLVTAWAFAHARSADGAVSPPGGWGVVALVSVDLFVFCYAASWGAILWVLLGEVFPISIRSAALGAATAVRWIADWLVSVSFPGLREWSLSVPTWSTRGWRCCRSSSCAASSPRPRAGNRARRRAEPGASRGGADAEGEAARPRRLPLSSRGRVVSRVRSARRRRRGPGCPARRHRPGTRS